jgi:hypothetical protein
VLPAEWKESLQKFHSFLRRIFAARKAFSHNAGFSSLPFSISAEKVCGRSCKLCIHIPVVGGRGDGDHVGRKGKLLKSTETWCGQKCRKRSEARGLFISVGKHVKCMKVKIKISFLQPICMLLHKNDIPCFDLRIPGFDPSIPGFDPSISWVRSQHYWARSQHYWARSQHSWVRSSIPGFDPSIPGFDPAFLGLIPAFLGLIPASSDTVESEGQQM